MKTNTSTSTNIKPSINKSTLPTSLFALAMAGLVLLLLATSALATPPTFTAGYLEGTDVYGNNNGGYDEPKFTFYVSGTPNSTWTVYALRDGNPANRDAIGTLQIGAGGTQTYVDHYAGSYISDDQFYQLDNGSESSAIFGYELVSIIEPDDNNSTGAEIQNPLIPLSPGTMNSVANQNAFWRSNDGSPYGLSTSNPPFFDDSTFNYDYWWEGDQWYMGDSFSFGYGDTYWFYNFPTTWRYGYAVDYVMISFIGTLPQ